jgi:DNA polymerase-3 subunit chi
VTEVEFHTGVPDKLAFACRLLRKAYRKGARVAVAGAPGLLTELDRALWTFDERDFVPHLRASASAAAPVRVRTPLWLLDAPLAAAEMPPVLVHLGGAELPAADQFSRVIEVVGTAPGDEAAGRERWRQYRQQGLQVVHHPTAAGDRP